MMNKRGMLANLIGGFIAVLIGVTLIPVIANQVNLAITCNSNSTMNITINHTTNLNDPYYGKTDSFGGGGTEHFGGYDGTVQHKSFLSDVGDYSVYKSNESIFNPGCIWQDDSTAMASKVLTLVPMFFAMTVLFVGIGIVYNALRTAGLLGGEEI